MKFNPVDQLNMLKFLRKGFFFLIKSISKINIVHYKINNRFRTEFIVCGIAPFNDMILVLAYLTDEIVQDMETDDPSQHRRPVCIIYHYIHCFYMNMKISIIK